MWREGGTGGEREGRRFYVSVRAHLSVNVRVKKRGGREVVCVRERVCAFEHECANAVQVRAFASAFACTRACMHTHACVRVYCSNGLASGLRIWG